MLLIEGADLLGKTTAAHKIVQIATAKLGEPTAYLKMGMESINKSSVRFNRQRIHPWTVADRMLFSDVIYAWHARQENTAVSAEEFSRICDLIVRVNGRVVVFHATPEDYEAIVRKTWRAGEDYRMEQCLRVNAAYHELATIGHLHWMTKAPNGEMRRVAMLSLPPGFVIPVKISFNHNTNSVVYASDDVLNSIAHIYVCDQKCGNFGLEI